MRRRKLKVALAIVTILTIGLVVLWFWKPFLPPIEVAEPGPLGRRIDETGVFGNYYPPPAEPRGSILLIGGSLGGIPTSSVRTAEALQAHGYAVLAASYFGAPNQPGHLEHIPLETFDHAIEWLTSQPDASPDRVALMGTSKGAEAALLIALRSPEVDAVIAAAPSSAVWPGINWDSLNGLNAGSSWTSEGAELPYVPYASFELAVLRGDIGRLYRNAVERVAEHPDAAIAIEDLDAPVLLVCGELDKLWPSCPMARQLHERAVAKDGPPVRVIVHEQVGHADFEPPYREPDNGPKPRWGGSAEDANAARAKTWPAVLEFLGDHLAS